MRIERYTPGILKVTLFLGLYLLVGAVIAVQAQDVPDVVRKAIERQFPGAVIKEAEEEVWKGQTVTEVEITTKDGVDYEVLVSESGEILHTEYEKGLLLIGGKLSLGGAVRAEQEIYKDHDWEVEAQPFFYYENGPFELGGYDGLMAKLRIYRKNVFAIRLIGSLQLDEGYDNNKSYFKGMKDLGTIYSVGLAFDWRFARKRFFGLEIGIDALQDISGEHDGQEVELTLNRTWTIAGFGVRPGLSLMWLSEDTVDYFFGVSSSEARPGRPEYSPGSSFEFGAELLIERPLFGNFSAVALGGISTFGNEITDSPLVDRDYEPGCALGVLYTW